MLGVLSRNWGWVVFRGVMAIIFGVLTFFYPSISLAVLVLWFGVFAIADGVGMIVSAIARHGEQHWFTLLIGGLFGIAAGIVTFMIPQITALVLLFVIATWAVVIGIAEIVAAIQLRKEISNEGLLVFLGLLSVAFGAFLIVNPREGALSVVLFIGVYAFISGILQLAFGFKLRRLSRSIATVAV